MLMVDFIFNIKILHFIKFYDKINVPEFSGLLKYY